MTKNFCDICGKEIEGTNNIYALRVTKNFEAQKILEIPMICPNCRKRLEDIIKNRKYWED